MRTIKFTHGTDFHGDMHDKRVKRAFLKHVELFDPDRRIFGGDLWDFRAWRKGASEKERRDRVRRDYRAGMEFFDRYAPTDFIEGNHDIRVRDQVEEGGPMADFCQDLIAQFAELRRKHKTRFIPYDKRRGILRIGKAKFAHGFFDGMNAARQMGQTYGSVMFGHGHSIDVASVPGAERRAARMVGALCRLDMPYNRKHVGALRQCHGWGYGYVFADGSFQQFQAERVGQRFVVADSIKLIPLS